MQHRRTTVALLVPGLLLSLAAAFLVAPADAAAATGTIHGTAVDTQGKRLSTIRVRIFTVQKDGSWAYLKAVTAAKDGEYSASGLEGGPYVLQFVDTRPSYDKTKHVTKDVKVTLAAGTSKKQDVHLRVGASLYGTALRHGRRAPFTTLKAVRDGDTTGRVYSTRSNDRGEYLLGGLPLGTYTVFSYDHARAYTAGPRRVTLRKYGVSTKLTFRMSTRAGRYTGLVLADGISLKDTVYVTAVNRSSGQFWVVKVVGGDLSSIKGLSPGRYDITVPGADHHLGKTFRNVAAIRSGGETRLSLNLTRQGGFVTGAVIDATSKDPLEGVEVTLYDKYSHPFDVVVTDDDGTFLVGGSIPDGDGPVTITLRARKPINEVRYVDRDHYAAGDVVTGRISNIGTVSLTRVPAPTPTPTTTASATP